MIVGNYLGQEALAAVGASYALTNVFIMIAIGGGNGASVLTSQYLGARDYTRLKTSISTALITFLLVSIILGGTGFLLNDTFLRRCRLLKILWSRQNCTWGFIFWGSPFFLCTMYWQLCLMLWGIQRRRCIC